MIHLKGTPYEMGFQHGRLLRKEVRESVSHVMKLESLYARQEVMNEVYDLMAPYILLEEKEEMRGLAHGAGLPLRLVHWYHAIPAVSEYKYKKRFSKGFTGTSCSNMVSFDRATVDGRMYQMRVLDWNRQMGCGNPSNETLEGIPFVFLFRKLMREASTLDQAVAMIETAKRTCSYVYLISDAKKSEAETNALMFISDRDRVLTFRENTVLSD